MGRASQVHAVFRIKREARGAATCIRRTLSGSENSGHPWLSLSVRQRDAVGARDRLDRRARARLGDRLDAARGDPRERDPGVVAALRHLGEHFAFARRETLVIQGCCGRSGGHGRGSLRRLRAAQAEAVRLNEQVVLSLSNAQPALNAAAVANGRNWSIQTVTQFGKTQTFVEGKSGSRKLAPEYWQLLRSLLLAGETTAIAVLEPLPPSPLGPLISS